MLGGEKNVDLKLWNGRVREIVENFYKFFFKRYIFLKRLFYKLINFNFLILEFKILK